MNLRLKPVAPINLH